jgi:hypothetical protein
MMNNLGEKLRNVALLATLAIAGSKAVPNASGVDLEKLGKHAETRHTLDLAAVEGENEPTKYTFGQIWDLYFDKQSEARRSEDKVKGYIWDYDKYCTEYGQPAGCGFDETDPKFDSEFHGHVYGYKAVNEGGKWYYIEDPNFVEGTDK